MLLQLGVFFFAVSRLLITSVHAVTDLNVLMNCPLLAMYNTQKRTF